MKTFQPGFLLILLSSSYALAGKWSYDLWRETGDVMIAFVTSAHENNASIPYQLRSPCGKLSIQEALLVSHFRMELKRLNQQLLPGVNIGFDILDACNNPTRSVYLSSQWVLVKTARLARPSLSPPPVAVIGTGSTATNAPTANFLQQFEIPTIDYASTSPEFSDRRQFRLFARSSKSDKSLAMALADVASELDHDCVHIVYSISNEKTAVDLRKWLRANNICISTDQIYGESSRDFIAEKIHSSNFKTRGLICLCHNDTFLGLLEKLENSKFSNSSDFQFLVGGSILPDADNLIGFEDLVGGSVFVEEASNQEHDIFDKKSFVSLAKNRDEHDPWLEELIESKFRCTFGKATIQTAKCDLNRMILKESDVPNVRSADLLGRAVLAVVDGLRRFMIDKCGIADFNTSSCWSIVNKGEMADRLYQSIISTEMIQNGKLVPIFDKYGDGVVSYHVTIFRKGSDSSSGRYEQLGTWTGEGAFNISLNSSKLPGTTLPNPPSTRKLKIKLKTSKGSLATIEQAISQNGTFPIGSHTIDIKNIKQPPRANITPPISADSRLLETIGITVDSSSPLAEAGRLSFFYVWMQSNTTLEPSIGLRFGNSTNITVVPIELAEVENSGLTLVSTQTDGSKIYKVNVVIPTSVCSDHSQTTCLLSQWQPFAVSPDGRHASPGLPRQMPVPCGPQCNSNEITPCSLGCAPCEVGQVAGADTPVTRRFDLGPKSGRVKLNFQTFSAKDRITAYSSGQLVFDSGCVGTQFISAAFISFFGSSELRIDVEPNCEGTSETQWHYLLECPYSNDDYFYEDYFE